MSNSTMIDLDYLITKTKEMAPLPASTVRLAQMVTHPNCHLDDVVELITFDQALTVKLLRAANSAASGSAIRIGTVQEAVMRMGTAQVLALAVASSTKSLLQSGVPAYGLDEGALWRHSVAAAVAAEIAPSFCKSEVPRETFTAALLHDVGKLVMARFLNEEILDYIKRAQQVDHLGLREAESLLLGVNHAELGGLVVQHWKLPAGVAKGIIYHHNPEQGGDAICYLTCLSDRMAQHLEANLDGREHELAIPTEVIERLGLTPNTIDHFCTSVASRYEQVSRRYNAV